MMYTTRSGHGHRRLEGRAVITLAQYQTEIEARIAWGDHDHVLLDSNHLQQVRLHEILL